MRVKLSDHDEYAIYTVAQVACPDPPKLKPGLNCVWVRNGWAIASDSYRVLAFPIESDLDGLIPLLDAQIGGTVTLTTTKAAMDNGTTIDVWERLQTSMPLHAAPNRAVLDSDVIDKLRPWSKRSTRGYHPPAWIVPPVLDGRARLDVAGDEIPLFDHDLFVAVDPRFLASVVVPLADHGVERYDNMPSGVEVHGGNWADPLAVTGIGWEPGDAWGLVMPIRTTWANRP